MGIVHGPWSYLAIITNWFFQIIRRSSTSTKRFKELVRGLCVGHSYVIKAVLRIGSLQFWDLLKKHWWRFQVEYISLTISWKCNWPRVLATFWEYTLLVWKCCAFSLECMARGIKVECFKKSKFDKHSCCLRVLTVLEMDSVVDNSCEEAKKDDVLAPGKNLLDIILRVYRARWTCKQAHKRPHCSRRKPDFNLQRMRFF